MAKEINSFSVEENGIRQINKTFNNGTTTSKMVEIESGKEVLRSKTVINPARTDIEYIDYDFWNITIDGEEASVNDLKSVGGPLKILALMNDRTIQIKTN